MKENFDYKSRFDWLQMMLESDLDPTAKTILAWLWKHLDRHTGTVARHWDSIAAATKIKKDTARKAMNRAKADGWVSWTGKGGIVYDDGGNRRGLACVFSLHNVGTSSQLDVDTWEAEANKVGTNTAQGGNEVPATWEPVPTNTCTSPVSFPVDNLSAASAADSHGKEEKKVQNPVLRPASMKERASWNGTWPNVSDLVATNLDTALDAKVSLTKEMLWVLGYRAGGDIEEVQARGERRVEVQHALDENTVHVMRMMSAARTLRKTDLADWLAINGFAPINTGDTNAQAA